MASVMGPAVGARDDDVMQFVDDKGKIDLNLPF
jgi:hypothetical protein